MTDAELALAHVCGKWPQARQVMKEKIAELEQRHFYFDLSFVVRCLTCVVRQRALFEAIDDDTFETVSLEIPVRLANVSAPERGQNGEAKETAALCKRIRGKKVIINIVALDKYCCSVV